MYQMGRFGGSPFFGSFREVSLGCLKPRETSISSCFQANTSPEISFGGRRGILAFWECLTKYPLRPPCREFPPSSPHALSSHPSVSTRHTEATRSVASATARDVSGLQQSSARRTVSPRPAMNRSWTALVGHGVTAPRIKRQPHLSQGQIDLRGIGERTLLSVLEFEASITFRSIQPSYANLGPNLSVPERPRRKRLIAFRLIWSSGPQATSRRSRGPRLLSQFPFG